MAIIAPAYDVLYDITSSRFEPSAWSIVVAGVGLGLGLWVCAFPKKQLDRVFGAAFALLSLLAGILTNWWLWSGHEEMRAGYVAGNFETVEGMVTSFRRGRPDCGQITFIVGGEVFDLRPKCEMFPGYQGRNIPELLHLCARVDVVAQNGIRRIAWIGTRSGSCD